MKIWPWSRFERDEQEIQRFRKTLLKEQDRVWDHKRMIDQLRQGSEHDLKPYKEFVETIEKVYPRRGHYRTITYTVNGFTSPSGEALGDLPSYAKHVTWALTQIKDENKALKDELRRTQDALLDEKRRER